MRESELRAQICDALNSVGFFAFEVQAECRNRYTGAAGAPRGTPDIRVEPVGWIEVGDAKRKARDQQHQLDMHRRIRAAGGRVALLPTRPESVKEAVRIALEWRAEQKGK